ncbi:hypothetical protein SLEP1_g14005 [Rubroshorea leprosula]|uniref:Uncharacterized protein n=1 Tax=Rubroshorea leprosula TaxID=152421 RepID=A0AAV5INM1_9ROSI|nr:hypothetical protein SLEP1_g14005 [Rubroshorea leprosula]
MFRQLHNPTLLKSSAASQSRGCFPGENTPTLKSAILNILERDVLKDDRIFYVCEAWKNIHRVAAGAYTDLTTPGYPEWRANRLRGFVIPEPFEPERNDETDDLYEESEMYYDAISIGESTMVGELTMVGKKSENPPIYLNQESESMHQGLLCSSDSHARDVVSPTISIPILPLSFKFLLRLKFII